MFSVLITHFTSVPRNKDTTFFSLKGFVEDIYLVSVRRLFLLDSVNLIRYLYLKHNNGSKGPAFFVTNILPKSLWASKVLKIHVRGCK